MAVSSVHLMLASLQVRDTPIGYTPPVGPPVRFTVRYNQRDFDQPPSAVTTVLGPKWTHDWYGYLQDLGAFVKYHVGGGGVRIFTGFDTNTQSYAPNQYDQTVLRRTGTFTYEMVWPDGSKKIFAPPFGRYGLSLYQVVDPAGNAVTLTYEDFGGEPVPPQAWPLPACISCSPVCRSAIPRLVIRRPLGHPFGSRCATIKGILINLPARLPRFSARSGPTIGTGISRILGRS